MNKIILILLSIIFLYKCNNEKVCTEEFKMLQVNITDTNNIKINIDRFYVVKESTNDTILSHLTTQYNDSIFEGITIFTDNEMKYTNNNGCEFIFSCYLDSTQIVNEKYLINHDDCHIDLISGKTNIEI